MSALALTDRENFAVMYVAAAVVAGVLFAGAIALVGVVEDALWRRRSRKRKARIADRLCRCGQCTGIEVIR